MDLILFIILLVVTYVTGSTIEKRHYQSITEREKALRNQPFVTDDFTAAQQENVEKIQMVTGSCVIAADRFKAFLGSLRSFFGGSIPAYESLADRARREALLRMRMKAGKADMIVQTRITFAEIGNGKIEVVAYGTALYLKK